MRSADAERAGRKSATITASTAVRPGRCYLVFRALRCSPLEIEQPLLPPQTAAVAAELAVCLNNAMTRNDDADAVVFRRMVPARRGKWRMLSQEVVDAARKKEEERSEQES